MIDRRLLKEAHDTLIKLAFSPLTPEAMAAAQGGMPPPPPGGEEGLVKVSLDDLKAVMEEVAGKGGGSEAQGGRVTNRQIMDRLEGLEAMLVDLIGSPMPADVGVMPPDAGMMPPDAGMGAPPPAGPADISQMLQQTGMPAQAAAEQNHILDLVRKLREQG